MNKVSRGKVWRSELTKTVICFVLNVLFVIPVVLVWRRIDPEMVSGFSFLNQFIVVVIASTFISVLFYIARVVLKIRFIHFLAKHCQVSVEKALTAVIDYKIRKNHPKADFRKWDHQRFLDFMRWFEEVKEEV